MRLRKRRRWQLPPISQHAMRQVWRQCYGYPMPRGWRIKWAGFMRGAKALCHEFVHVSSPRLRHGKEFSRLMTANLTKCGLYTPQAITWGTAVHQGAQNNDTT